MGNDIKDLGDSIKRPNILVLGIFKSMEKKNGLENLFSELLVENFLNSESKTPKN